MPRRRFLSSRSLARSLARSKSAVNRTRACEFRARARATRIRAWFTRGLDLPPHTFLPIFSPSVSVYVRTCVCVCVCARVSAFSSFYFLSFLCCFARSPAPSFRMRMQRRRRADTCRVRDEQFACTNEKRFIVFWLCRLVIVNWVV